MYVVYKLIFLVCFWYGCWWGCSFICTEAYKKFYHHLWILLPNLRLSSMELPGSITFFSTALRKMCSLSLIQCYLSEWRLWSESIVLSEGCISTINALLLSVCGSPGMLRFAFLLFPPFYFILFYPLQSVPKRWTLSIVGDLFNVELTILLVIA